MGGCGLRVQELLDLQVKDITFKGKTKGKIFDRKGKGNKSRPTTLTEVMVAKVHDYVQGKKLKDEDRLFTNRLGKPYMSGCSLNKTLQHYCKKTKPPINKKITNHSFRHMFGTETTEKCGLATAQLLMGHKSPSTTALYNHPRFEVHQIKFKQCYNAEGPNSGHQKGLTMGNKEIQIPCNCKGLRLVKVVDEEKEELKEQLREKNYIIDLKDRIIGKQAYEKDEMKIENNYLRSKSY